MTLSKLSLRNARRQDGDYLIYLVTVILSAALIHAFNGLVFSQELLTLSQARIIPLSGGESITGYARNGEYFFASAAQGQLTLSTHDQYALLNPDHEEAYIEIEMQMSNWVENHNAKRPYRMISNVTILEIKPLAFANIRFEI